MTALEGFIARRIAKAAQESVKQGKARYKAYFVNTSIHQGCRDAVDAALREAGCEKAIVV